METFVNLIACSIIVDEEKKQVFTFIGGKKLWKKNFDIITLDISPNYNIRFNPKLLLINLSTLYSYWSNQT